MSAPRQPKADRPETLRQARTWDEIKGRYIAAGACHACAAQAAYGHQLGFSRVAAPCPSCLPPVAAFPVAAVNGWRKLPKKARDATALPASALAGRWGGLAAESGNEVAA